MKAPNQPELIPRTSLARNVAWPFARKKNYNVEYNLKICLTKISNR